MYGKNFAGFLNIIFLSFIPEYHRRLCSLQWYPTETHIKREATLHDCLPKLLGGGDKWIEIVYGEEKILYWAD
jgi:hypothetical protein